MEFVAVFAVGVLFGFATAWLWQKSTMASSKQERLELSDQRRELSEQFGSLQNQLHILTESTSQLQRVLSERGLRGKWGERRVLEILELAGFEEGKHFRYQKAAIGAGDNRIIPDFTIIFPNNTTLHVDSKFPLEHYEAYLSADSDFEREQCAKSFIKSVRGHIDSFDRKGYIAPGTTHFALLFIPFESLFRFVHEQDNSIMDHGLERRVVLCSPLTFYIILAVIRQSIDAFAYNRAAEEFRQKVEGVKNEWEKYNNELDKIGNALEKANATYGTLRGTRYARLFKQFTGLEQVLELHRRFPTESE